MMWLLTKVHRNTQNKPSTIKRQFSEVRNKTRPQSKKLEKQDRVIDVKFIATYNPALPNINKIIHNNWSILHSDENMKTLFPPSSLTTVYRREKNLMETLSPSLFPPKFNKNESSISSCINVISTGIISYMLINLSLAGRMYSVRGILSCNSPNVSYLISYKNYGDQHVGSTTDFKARSKIQKSGIKTKKDGCGTATHFNNKYCDRNNPNIFLQVQLIESVQSDVNLEGKL